MRPHANHALVSAVWRRSSASAWSWVSRYAVRSSPRERAATNSSKSTRLVGPSVRGSVTGPPASAVIPGPTRWPPPMVARSPLLLPRQEGRHRLAGGVGGEEPGAELGHLVAVGVDPGDQVAVEDALGLAQPLRGAGGERGADPLHLGVELVGGHRRRDQTVRRGVAPAEHLAAE